MANFLKSVLILFFAFLWSVNLQAQHSVARQWNEVLLNAIRKDYARPTVHARNLFHTSVAMYDAWAVYDTINDTYFLGNSVAGFSCDFDGVEKPVNRESAQEETMSYAVYRLLNQRFKYSPGFAGTRDSIDQLFADLGYNPDFESEDYSTGSAAALGNYLGNKLIEFGLQDGSNEKNQYVNLYYQPINQTLLPAISGNPNITNLNRWQPLSLETFIDQSGNTLPKVTPEFLSPEWGNVSAFALADSNLTTFTRDENEYRVFHDPGKPPYLDLDSERIEYQWNFSLVSIWSSHLDTADKVMLDISPASFGNVTDYPTTWSGFQNFYNTFEGGDAGEGRSINPKTNQPYEEQVVPRADYARVLAEFWADGPDSETPPGHWFTILNYVNDHQDFEKKFKGTGDLVDNLEWDVKAYFILGGAMHDAAITAWGVKGWYDYIRPISAIRCMADLGQSTDDQLSNYHKNGIPLEPGYVEVVESGDPLAGTDDENIGKIKVYAWKGPDFIEDPDVDMAGVDWILAENWWPYQRPTFVTPPFAGYVSGHSVFSRAAAEVLTLLTGDEYFPGGMGEFVAKKNEFLVFEEGPSVDVTLQWATYRDASDQTSLSRIWGGIHPPADDVPGRLMGEKVGVNAFAFAEEYFQEENPNVVPAGLLETTNVYSLYPNPVNKGAEVYIEGIYQSNSIQLINPMGETIKAESDFENGVLKLKTEGVNEGVYFLKVVGENLTKSKRLLIVD